MQPSPANPLTVVIRSADRNGEVNNCAAVFINKHGTSPQTRLTSNVSTFNRFILMNLPEGIALAPADTHTVIVTSFHSSAAFIASLLSVL